MHNLPPQPSQDAIAPALRPVVFQWRVAWLSLLAAGLVVLSLGASSMDDWHWTRGAAPVGLIVGLAGAQVLFALRQERIAGVVRRGSGWTVVTVVLFAAGAGLIALGTRALWQR